MASGHSVYTSENCVGLVADSDKVIVERLFFDRTRDSLCVRVDLREGRSDGLVYLTPSEAMRLAKELRALAIAAFEDV